MPNNKDDEQPLAERVLQLERTVSMLRATSSPLLTRRILQRTIKIKHGSSVGTAFTIDIDERQYLVTARHVVPGIGEKGTVEGFQGNVWKQISVRTIPCDPDGVDIIVLCPNQRLTSVPRVEATQDGLAWGQQVGVLGFPFGFGADLGEVFGDAPAPLVFRGALAAMFSDAKSVNWLILDVQSNPGLSGAPVVFTDMKSGELCVAGVVSGPCVETLKVKDGNKATDLRVTRNSGIVRAFSISHAVEAIKANPVGFPIAS